MDADANIGDGVVVSSTQQIGELLRAARKASNINQQDLAGLFGSGNRFIVEAEKGKETLQAQKLIDLMRMVGLEIVVRRRRK